MFLRLVLSAGLMCGLAAASEQSLQVLNTTPRTMQACTQLALQNAVNPARQKKLAQENVMAGGINYPYLLGHDYQKLGTKTIVSAQNQSPGGCAIPLTQEHASAGTQFEVRAIPAPKIKFDALTHSAMPVCDGSVR